MGHPPWVIGAIVARDLSKAMFQIRQPPLPVLSFALYIFFVVTDISAYHDSPVDTSTPLPVPVALGPHTITTSSLRANVLPSLFLRTRATIGL